MKFDFTSDPHLIYPIRKIPRGLPQGKTSLFTRVGFNYKIGDSHLKLIFYKPHYFYLLGSFFQNGIKMIKFRFEVCYQNNLRDKIKLSFIKPTHNFV